MTFLAEYACAVGCVKMLFYKLNEFVQCPCIFLCSVSRLLLFSFSFHVLSSHLLMVCHTLFLNLRNHLFLFLYSFSFCVSLHPLLSRSHPLSQHLCLPQDLHLYNSSVLRPRVVGEWVGREEDDSDPLAAEMLQPPVPRAKTESWGSGETSPAGR